MKKQKKELQRELKKHLLDKLKSYTNVIELKGTKYRIDDLVKDLDKIEDNEVLVQILEKEEIHHKTTKEKKINKNIKEKDYITRETREREYKRFLEHMTDEEKYYLEQLENKEKINFDIFHINEVLKHNKYLIYYLCLKTLKFVLVFSSKMS